MSKALKIWLIVAGALVVCGLIIACCSVAAVGFQLEKLNLHDISYINFSDFPNSPANRVEYKLTGTDYQSITIDEDIGTVKIEPSPDGKYSVSYIEHDDYKHTVADDGKSFRLTGRGDLNSRSAFDFIFGWMRDDTRSRTTRFQVTVNVPADFAGELGVLTSCGDIDIKDINCNNNINIENKLGECSLKNVSAAKVSVYASAGDVDLDRVNSETLSVTDHLGTVGISNSNCEGDAVVSANAGSIDLDWFSAGKLDVTDNLGSISLKRATVSGNCKLNADMGDVSADQLAAGALRADCKTGSIEIDKLLCGDIELEVNSGSVDCTIDGDPQNYRVSADSDLGEVNVSHSGNSGGTNSVSAKTNLGDVNIKFDD